MRWILRSPSLPRKSAKKLCLQQWHNVLVESLSSSLSIFPRVHYLYKTLNHGIFQKRKIKEDTSQKRDKRDTNIVRVHNYHTEPRLRSRCRMSHLISIQVSISSVQLNLNSEYSIRIAYSLSSLSARAKMVNLTNDFWRIWFVPGFPHKGK